jgi:hypothetical protein
VKNKEELSASFKGKTGSMNGYKGFGITMRLQKTEMSSNNLPPVMVEKRRKIRGKSMN